VELAFGPGVRSIGIADQDGAWRLEVEAAEGRLRLSYDDAHRRLAAALGWAALPSPADTVTRTARGYRAEGVGLGHRVGLCLAADRR
jgi:hypothetical protein